MTEQERKVYEMLLEQVSKYSGNEGKSQAARTLKTFVEAVSIRIGAELSFRASLG